MWTCALNATHSTQASRRLLTQVAVSTASTSVSVTVRYLSNLQEGVSIDAFFVISPLGNPQAGTKITTSLQLSA